jgi:hypothetical protein
MNASLANLQVVIILRTLADDVIHDVKDNELYRESSK